jgi:hypothetical protein
VEESMAGHMGVMEFIKSWRRELQKWHSGTRWKLEADRASFSFPGNLKTYALVAHACNPRYSGGRDQEDLSQPMQIAHRHHISKNPSQK